MSDFKINPVTVSLTWQVIIERVRLGFELQELTTESLIKEQIVKYNDSIIISPDYQREYRSSVSDESSLVESALIGIPIPPIFLASYKLKGVQVLNVVDGQHRLRAFYRYFTGKFKLTDLKILEDYNSKYFNDLDVDDITSLQSRDISTITFRGFPGKEFELEIFNRYNKGTKPLTPQEIRHAVFDSQVNELVNKFCKYLFNNPKTPIGKAYAITKDRYQKKTCQENVFVILSILENGVDQTIMTLEGNKVKLVKSPQYAEHYMEIKSVLEKEGEEKSKIELAKTHELFIKFNDFIENIAKIVEYPFSREIYGVSRRGNKFQVSISMILAGVFNKLVRNSFDARVFCDKEEAEVFVQKLSNLLNNSYLEDPDYKASTTNPIEIQKVVDLYEI
ncbi:MAG: DUF262 domain-containing protein [Pseudomonadota bacterium]